MQTVTTKAMAKVAAVATGLAMATSILSLAPMAHAAALTSAQVSSILSLLSSFGADSATIANVNASLTGGTPSTTTTTTTSTGGACSFSKNLTIGSTGMEVTCLQTALIAGGFSIPAGATGYFGSQTRTAVASWQSSKNIAPAVGYFGAISRAAFNLGGGTTTTTTGTTTTTAGTGTGLKVSLSPTSPNGTVLVQGQGIGDLGDFVFANPTATPINVTGLSFKRIGVSNDSTMVNVYLYNAGARITDSAGVSASAFTFSDPIALFTVGAGQTYTVSVRSDIAGSTSGQQIGVQLVSATSNGTLDASVSFPINSGYQTISAANLATVNFAASPTPSSIVTISPANDYPVWQDTVTASTNPVKLSSMKFMNLGSANSSDITNLRLMVDGVQVGSTVTAMSADRSVTFDLMAAPFAMTTQGHVVKVLANIGVGAASRTIQFSVQRSSDGMFVDSQLNQPVTPTYNSTTWSAASTAVITINSASVAGVSVSRNPSSPTTKIAVGASAQKWASFDILASGENVKVSDLYVSAATSIHNGGLNNGMIRVNGVQVGSTKDIGETGDTTDFSLGSSLILPAGIVTTVDVYADAQTSTSTNLSNNETVAVSLMLNASNGQGMSSLTTTGVPTADVAGNTITVSSSSLTATKATGYGNQQFVAGSTNAKIGSFVLGAGATEGVTVNTISITFPVAVSSTITNLTIKDSATGTTLGSAVTTPQSGSNSFYVSFDVPASSNKTIDIYANIMSGANVGTIQTSVGTGTSGSGDVTNTLTSVAGAVALQTITLGNGTFSVAKGAGDPASSLVLAGSSSVKVGQFKFSGANSSYTVNDLAILVPNNAATAVTTVALSYKDVNGAVKTASATLTVDAAMAYATATFTGLGMYVPTNSSANLDVFVGTPTIASGGTSNISGAGINVTLDSAAGTFSESNSAGTVTAGFSGGNVASAGTFYVRKSIPTLSAVALSSTLTNATQFAIGRVKVTADAAGDIAWGKMVFAISKNTEVLLDATSTLKVYKGSTLVSGVFATTTGSLLGGLDTFGAATSGSIVFIPATEQQIAAGDSVTYELRANVTGVTTGKNNYVNVSIANPNSSNTTGSFATVAGSDLGDTTKGFVWSDMSASGHDTSTLDWTNEYLLTGLPLTLANSSVSL